SATANTCQPSLRCDPTRSSTTRSCPPTPKERTTWAMVSGCCTASLLPSAPQTFQHHQRRLDQNAELHRQIGFEVLERSHVGHVVEKLHAHVVGFGAFGIAELVRVGQIALEKLDVASLEHVAGVAERNLREPGDARLDPAHALLEERD